LAGTSHFQGLLRCPRTNRQANKEKTADEKTKENGGEEQRQRTRRITEGKGRENYKIVLLGGS
jgi:hypothetical protein